MSVAIDNRDKAAWCRLGESYEREFVRLMEMFPGPFVAINPAKESDPFAPDLIVGGALADLKTQTEPFYTAARYGMEPTFTVSYNRKDYERYARHYPSLRLFFWVRWAQTTGYGVTVAPVWSVRTTTADEIACVIEDGSVVEHRYAGRVDDRDGNARSSFLLDLRWMDEVLAFRGIA